jgi:hypothetical protein
MLQYSTTLIKLKNCFGGGDVLTALTMKIIVFWDVKQWCSQQRSVRQLYITITQELMLMMVE